ncbi:4-hydroxy-tetrahydrodipicolinate synthase [Wenzhouxiangella sp. XN24]|uniref:4-hydroxy-tetrahydrodipicolinate synthase n=1 Tax=Wenzhouxiangella sp. XN24 TaxID=2713569 RepID=UPI0013EA7AFF|nr:4-hydroxy-tetrahydrodipicolinate synthase [Wenzhouxiangella sp. XN24]NGX15439.1 4-hydroxy-tetrahydrodipicolinate synthase [Wenzhouxiangella sp. XN24]
MFGGSIVALVTPMHGDGDLDLEALGRLVEFHVEAGTDGIVIAGTTGESPCLSSAELDRLIRAALEAAAGRVSIIGGSGSNSTVRAIELTAVVREAGAAAALVVTPYYNRPTQEGLFRHYQAVARAGLPVILYNVPSRTACDLLPETVARLAEVPGIVAVKEAVPGAGRIGRLRELLGDRLDLLSGDDATAMDFLLAGGNGVISVTANVAPRLMHGLAEAGCHGEPRKAAALNDRLEGLHRALFIEPSPIPVKWAVMQMGLIQSGIRLPLTPLEDRHHDEVRVAMARAGVEYRS